jgi:hypothetical protein
MMPVRYHYAKEKRPQSYLTEPAFLVLEALLLCVLLVTLIGFRAHHWLDGDARIHGVIVETPVSSPDPYKATIRDVETGRRYELDLKDDEEVGDRVEAIRSPDDESEAVRWDDKPFYVTAALWSLLGLLLWPALWVILRWNGTVESPRP